MDEVPPESDHGRMDDYSKANDYEEYQSTSKEDDIIAVSGEKFYSLPSDTTAATSYLNLLHLSHSQIDEDQASYNAGDSKGRFDSLFSFPPKITADDSRKRLPLIVVAVDYPEELREGLEQISEKFLHKNFFLAGSNVMDNANYQPILLLSIKKEAHLLSSLVIKSSADFSFDARYQEALLSVDITYRENIDAFRALGHVLSLSFVEMDTVSLVKRLTISEVRQFTTSGLMLDCSRGSVPTQDTVFYILRLLALNGLNTLQLYTEDTYEVPGEPFFGYLRGRYSQKELSEFDEYASIFGIEMFPCIQTLGHLGQVLQWQCYSEVRDTQDIILSNCGKTYDLLEKMICSVSKPFKSKRIHLGMDEAFGIGEGRYKHIYGRKPRIEIFMDHLRRVTEICHKHCLKPMIWSDLLFGYAGGLSDDYDPSMLPYNISKSVTDELDVVYWDYYSLDLDNYSNKIKLHMSAGYRPWVAGGVWTWNRLFAALPYTIEASDACLKACKKNKIENVFVTAWGDDSSECDLYSALPALILYGNHTYAEELDTSTELLKIRFEGLCGGCFMDWIYASNIDGSLPFDNRVKFPKNMSKWLLWQDPIYSFWNTQCKDINLQAHYQEICRNLKPVINRNSDVYPINYRLKFPYLIAKVLSIKCIIREKLSAAYHSKLQKRELEFVRKNYIAKLSRELDKLWRFHRDYIWLSTNKPFGLEMLEMRYGTIRARLTSISDRISSISAADSKMMDVDNFNEHVESLPHTPKYQGGEDDESDADSVEINIKHPLRLLASNNFLPELDIEILEPYNKAGSELIIDFSRAYTPAKMSWTT